MFRPQPMKYVRLLVLTEDLPQAALALAETESFHPDTRPPLETQLTGLPARAYRDCFNQARSRLDKLAKLVAEAEAVQLEQVRVVALPELTTLNDWLGELWQQGSVYEEELRRLDDQERLIREQEASLANFQHLNIDLRMLRTKTRFLDFYVGIVPVDNLRRLEDAVVLAEHLLHVYMQREHQVHVVIVGPTGTKEAQLSAVLNAAGFQPLPIPQNLDDDPQRVHQELEAQRQMLQVQRATLQRELTTWSAGFRPRLTEARRTLLLAEPLINLDPSLRSTGHLAYLAGWVPARALEALRRQLDASLTLPFDLLDRRPTPNERRLVPSVPVRSRLLQPFALLVKQCGIPEYGEIDPTPLFAVTFLLMFGMMFGDIGHGAVIVLAAILARRRLPNFWRFGLLAGCSSMGFGLVFGSVFGYEDILPALWMSPLHDPILMLKVALGWGVVFIVMACLLGIYNRVAIGNLQGALLGPHGAVNLLFYLAFIWGGYGLATTGAFGILPALLIVGSLSALAVFQWRHLEAPPGERLLMVFIETLETVIVYLSNTLSFLRVSAFSLNHVALSLAVFTLADMMGTFGHLVTVVLGNVFVLVLEGGIVMIQVMRLQYYEGFSRYFTGDGVEFAPLRLRRGTAAP